MSNRRIKYFMARVRRFVVTTFVGGFLVVLPVTIFVIIVGMAVNFIVNLLTPIKSILGMEDASAQGLVNLLAFAIVMTLFFFIGLFVSTDEGRDFFNYIEENFLMQLPMYASIKETTNQFLGRKKMPFEEVVSVDVFGNSTRMIGFITDEAAEGELLTVFVPTGPNPTNGFIFCVRENQVQRLNVKTDQAMRMVIGVGTGAGKLFTQDYKDIEPEPYEPGELEENSGS